MTIPELISVLFLAVMVVLVIRGIRGHPRRNEGVELDATGRAVAVGARRRAERLETETFSDPADGGGGD